MSRIEMLERRPILEINDSDTAKVVHNILILKNFTGKDINKLSEYEIKQKKVGKVIGRLYKAGLIEKDDKGMFHLTDDILKRHNLLQEEFEYNDYLRGQKIFRQSKACSEWE